MFPLISVIVPVYNVEHYLDRCLESIVTQSYPYLEVILVDDGSTDRSSAIADTWADKDERIRVYHKKNGGASEARNYGLDRANGKYIAFVDSDDYISSDMYLSMIEAIHSTNSDLACCGRFYKSENLKRASRCTKKPRIMTPIEAIHELLNNGCVDEAAWDKLYRAELWDNLRFPLGETNEDLVVIPEIIRRCKKIIHIAKPYYYYCYNENSVTKSGYSNEKDIMFKNLNDLTAFIQKYYPDELVYVNVIKAKYALNTLFSIVLRGEMKRYPHSYKGYKKMLSKSYVEMIKCNNFTKKQKTEAGLLILGIYKPVWELKKFCTQLFSKIKRREYINA